MASYEPAWVDAAHLKWLEQTQEEVIDPDRRIVDPHHHLWDARAPLSNHKRPYIDEEGNEAMGGLHVATDRPGGGVDPAAMGWQQRYTLDDISHDIQHSGHAIKATVFVECGSMFNTDDPAEMRCVGETEFVNGIAAMSASGAYGTTQVAAGIVSTIDMGLGELTKPLLEAHMKASKNFRGIRAPVGDPSDAKFAASMRLLEQHQLVYEVGVPCDQLAQAIAVAEAFPGVRMVLNHCGECAGPAMFGEGTECESNWRDGIQHLGKLPNVFAKVGGCTMTFNGWGFEKREQPVGSEEFAQLLEPIYSHVIRSFGPEKSMFESNFPVDKCCLSYLVLWNGYKRVAESMGLDERQKDALFYQTAVDFYRLQLRSNE